MRPPREPFRLTVLAVVDDEATRSVLPKVITSDRLLIAREFGEGVAYAEADTPDIAFVDIGLGGGAGLAMIHHIKALAPEAVVYALATRSQLESASHAVSLGGAGLLLLPLGGDEVMNAVTSVRVRLTEQKLRLQLEQESTRNARVLNWLGRVGELADAQDRNAASQRLAEVLMEATRAVGVAIYVVAGERTTELIRTAVTPTLERAPAFGNEVDILDYARRHHLQVLPLALRKVMAGHILFQSVLSTAGQSTDADRRATSQALILDDVVKLIAVQATTVLALHGERDRASGGVSMKDPTSSAYSFAYYVDVAGREIDKAKRHKRRFTIATIILEAAKGVDVAAGGQRAMTKLDLPWQEAVHAKTSGPGGMSAAEVADQLLHAVRDTDILARVEDNEFHLLMPETDGLEAHACYRRMLARLSASTKQPHYLPEWLLIGVATFPHDGQSLAQLLRVARRRAEATKASLVRRLVPDHRSIDELYNVLLGHVGKGKKSFTIHEARPFTLGLPETISLATSVIKSALRGGPILVVVAHHAGLSIGGAVRTLLAATREEVVIHALDVRSVLGSENVEALCVIAQHGAYAFIGRSDNGVVQGIHASDPLLADFLAERLGRAAGLRVFG